MTHQEISISDGDDLEKVTSSGNNGLTIRSSSTGFGSMYFTMGTSTTCTKGRWILSLRPWNWFYNKWISYWDASTHMPVFNESGAWYRSHCSSATRLQLVHERWCDRLNRIHTNNSKS